MNNLLRTLTASEVKSSLADTDLKLLLSTVKESRRNGTDQKLSDAFYDSLEGLLIDLRTVTMDNHDADAFLKPVSRADVPDYYDFISNPMDLQTMLKKVKSKQYKSKKEFKDDLDLIWANCLTYNAAPDHPLRQCAKRLQAKSEKLLKNITDRKERTDPLIPSDLPGRSPSAILLKPNGINGHARSLSSTPAPNSVAKSVIRIPPIAVPRRRSGMETTFPETPAIIRTVEGMSAFKVLNEEMDVEDSNIEARLRSYTLEDSEDSLPEPESDEEHATIGEKRKLNGMSQDPRPRKRARRSSSTSNHKHRVELWWDVVQSDQLLGNGLPALRYSSSTPTPSSSLTPQTTDPPPDNPATKRKKRKKVKDPQSSKTLLGAMNNNIRTMHRLRNIHAKFSNMKDSNPPNNEDGGLALPGPPPVVPEPIDLSSGPSLAEKMSRLNDTNPWTALRGSGGIDVGTYQAEKCLNWMGGKILEHAGFQGASKVAMEVLSGVASEYLLNVGRTIQYLSNKYAKKMTPEEIILHTLFESGITRVDDLERYIQDDVVRYGGRITELEKKLENAYHEATNDEVIDDEALFGNDDDEDSAFVMGDLTDAFGDDFLGLRELGIAGELGLSSLSVPKKLMKAKPGSQLRNAQPTKPKEPPPPFPPPPPFIPVDASRIDNQIIGLLRPYYKGRLDALAGSALSKPPGTASEPGEQLPIALQDDAPNAVQTKMSPLGQIAGGKAATAAAVGAAKKKPKKEKEGAVMPPAANDGALPSALGSDAAGAAMKKRGGPGRGKKGKMGDPPPRIVVASA